ncbi:glycoside hydrolase family 26 protein [Dyadobacter frigoris]|uniref:Mannan endo-1,4-beta-mannosidase n=1 Tax=Dyadobacter frigoris TaxID=2576211 RepID=A0A4U6DCQ0_9BACT|nr:glycosyl hydrolase [Dyadobacter frigoris]TKT94281.1 beta-mannosidase [Dyadobacter frigoris]GLU56615.1 mannan endo-1,4-beta-mannosidase [Dyadobacter frigoris]
MPLTKSLLSLFLSFEIILLASGFSFAQIDKNATPATKNLYSGLKRSAAKGVILGQQDALAYGLNADKSRWIGDEGRSDVKTVSGEHPALIGYDLGHIELDSVNNLDGVPFERIREDIRKNYERGGVNTISWHPNNPLDFSKTAWDKEEFTIRKILSDQTNKKNFEKTLDKLATFFLNLKDSKGDVIPVIFRPYHEHTGSWFWWGADHCTPEEYKQFWKFTIDYLQKTKKVHSLLTAYSTDNFKNKEHYLERYPGDNFVDILGFDTYHRNPPASDSAFIANAKRMTGTIRDLGKTNGKPFAITETGLEQLTEPTWWTHILQPILENSGLSYVLVWRNGRPDHYYAPFEGNDTAEDFKKLQQSGNILLEKKVASENLYGKPARK